MPLFNSRDWDEEVGSCVKHGIPVTPCPVCLSDETEGENVSVVFTQMECMIAEDERIPLSDFLPDDAQWLMKNSS